MKKKMVLCGFFGLVGIAGALLGSKQLMAFLLFFLLFALAPMRLEDDDFAPRIKKVLAISFVLSLFSFGTIFLLSAILGGMPMITRQMPLDVLLLIMIEALSWCFAFTIAAFTVGSVAAGITSHIKSGKPQ